MIYFLSLECFKRCSHITCSRLQDNSTAKIIAPVLFSRRPYYLRVWHWRAFIRQNVSFSRMVHSKKSLSFSFFFFSFRSSYSKLVNLFLGFCCCFVCLFFWWGRGVGGGGGGRRVGFVAVSKCQSINQLYLNTVNGSASWFSDMPCDNYNL